MKLEKMMKQHRQQELRAVFRFIHMADLEETAEIINEIRTVHDNIYAFNEKHKSLDKVGSVSLNGDSIQLNLEI